MLKKFLFALSVAVTVVCACQRLSPVTEPSGEGDPDPVSEPDPEIEAAPDTICASIENEYVRKYIDYVYANPYTESDFSVSYIDKFYLYPRTLSQANRLKWGDRPAPVTFSWNTAAAAKSQTVSIACDEAFSNVEYISNLNSSQNTFSVYNLIPGRKYYCKVTATLDDNSTKDIYNAVINVTGRRRMIAVTSVGNVRDLGGLKTSDGTKQVKYGLIFRGSRLNNNGFRLSAEDIETLKKAGVRADLDLREDSADKIGSDIYGKGISPLGDGVDYHLFPKANKSYFKNLLVNDEYIKALQWIIDELRSGKPVYFHCKTGADRTGTLGFLIESLLDISEADKSIDFELTSFFFDFGDPNNYAFRSRSLSMNSRMGVSTNYDWAGMHNVIASLGGNTYQQKTYKYFSTGVNSTSARISSTDLDWFINYMLEDVGGE